MDTWNIVLWAIVLPSGLKWEAFEMGLQHTISSIPLIANSVICVVLLKAWQYKFKVITLAA
jgi:hypothetical protein